MAHAPEPADPNQPDNFWKPIPRDLGAHGQFDNVAQKFSVELWASKHRAGLIGGLLAAGAGLAGLLIAKSSHNGNGD